MRAYANLIMWVLFLTVGPLSAEAQKIWRCEGNVYSNEAIKGKSCAVVEVPQAAGAKGERMFMPKGGKVPLSKVRDRTPAAGDTAAARTSQVLFETNSTRPLKSAVKKRIDGPGQPDSKEAERTVVEGTALRCLLASLVGDTRAMEGCNATPDLSLGLEELGK